MLRDFYEYKCNIYARLYSPFKMKVPLTGEWLECVAYLKIDSDRFRSGKGIYTSTNLPNFCREKKDFEAKFKKIKFLES